MPDEEGPPSPILKPHNGRDGRGTGAASPTQESAALLLAGFATSEDHHHNGGQNAGMDAPPAQFKGMLPRRPGSVYAGSFSVVDQNAPAPYGFQSGRMPDAAASAAAAVHQAMSAVQMEQTKLVLQDSDSAGFKRRRRPPNPPIRRRQRVCAVMTTSGYANAEPPLVMAHRPPQPEIMRAQQFQQVGPRLPLPSPSPHSAAPCRPPSLASPDALTVGPSPPPPANSLSLRV